MEFTMKSRRILALLFSVTVAIGSAHLFAANQDEACAEKKESILTDVSNVEQAKFLVDNPGNFEIALVSVGKEPVPVNKHRLVFNLSSGMRVIAPAHVATFMVLGSGNQLLELDADKIKRNEGFRISGNGICVFNMLSRSWESYISLESRIKIYVPYDSMEAQATGCIESKKLDDNNFIFVFEKGALGKASK
ncbi:MAG: hypothetical protein ACREGC_01895 [Minisyncoccia bacterium]